MVLLIRLCSQMKSKLSFFFLIVLLTGFTSDQPHKEISSSDILGTYWNDIQDVKVRIFLAQNGKYSGKVVWLRNPHNDDGSVKRDPNNPNHALRDRERVGLVIIKYFEFNDKEKRWEGGLVYNPKNGRTYQGYIQFNGDNTNEVLLRGYILGLSWLGRTEMWTRVAD